MRAGGGGDGNGGSLKDGRKGEDIWCGGWVGGDWDDVGGSGIEGSMFGGDGGVRSLDVDAALRSCVIPYDGGGRRWGRKCWRPSPTREITCVTFKIHKPCCCPCSCFFHHCRCTLDVVSKLIEIVPCSGIAEQTSKNSPLQWKRRTKS